MAVRNEPWPTWKIAAAAVVGAASSVGLAKFAFFLESVSSAPPSPHASDVPAGVPLANMMLVLATASALLSLFCLGWLIRRRRHRLPARIHPSRIRPKRR